MAWTGHRLKVIGRGAGCAAAAVLVALAVAIALATLAPRVAGCRSYVITGGSMTGTYDRGSVVFECQRPVAALRRGDVITYLPPASTGLRAPVTHRIVSVLTTRSGERVFRTKGDANASPDPWRFTLHGQLQPRALFGVPLVGYAIAALDLRVVRLIVLGLPALVIALMSLGDVWYEVRPQRMSKVAA